MTDLEIAMAEIDETATDLADMSLSNGFQEQLERIRLDVAVSPYFHMTDEMCKWAILAYKRDAALMYPNKANEALKAKLERAQEQGILAWTTAHEVIKQHKILCQDEWKRQQGEIDSLSALAYEQGKELRALQHGNCDRHPDAPHGFDRSGSHNAGRYVCTCESS